MNLAALFKDDNGSARRYLVGIPAMFILAINYKLGLGIPAEGQALIAGIAIAMVTGSNLKEAIVAHADAKVQAAALENPAEPVAAVPPPKPTVP